MTIARLPLAKEVDEFDFDATPVNETLVRELVLVVSDDDGGEAGVVVDLAEARPKLLADLGVGRAILVE